MEPFFRGKPTQNPSYGAAFGTLSIFVLCGSCYFAPVASLPAVHCKLDVDLAENTIACMPFSQKHLIASYIEKHNSLPGTEFNGFLEHFSHNCEGLAHDINDVLGVSDLHRHLIGEGSHRRIVSSVAFNIQPGVQSWLDAHFCEAVIIERLPTGVFADPFELQHLVQRQVFLDAAVFGDTNLELPSALSNQSIVEIHMDIEHGNLPKCCDLVIELPLHARYPPLDASGYSRVEMGAPDLFVRCRPKLSQHESSSYWTLASLSVRPGNTVPWSIPCGNEEHAGFVSAITFFSALLSSLLLVFAAMYYSTDDDIKRS